MFPVTHSCISLCAFECILQDVFNANFYCKVLNNSLVMIYESCSHPSERKFGVSRGGCSHEDTSFSVAKKTNTLELFILNSAKHKLTWQECRHYLLHHLESAKPSSSSRICHSLWDINCYSLNSWKCRGRGSTLNVDRNYFLIRSLLLHFAHTFPHVTW